MSEATSGTAPADDLGVVNPIRIPGVPGATRAWRRLPTLGRAFVVLAVVDLIARTLQLGGLGPGVSLDYPLAIVTAQVPRFLLILLPTVILWRRADAASATPFVVRGAFSISLGLLVPQLLTPVLFNPDTGPSYLGQLVVSGVSAALWTYGYVAIAIGLLRQSRPSPTPSLRGLANLAAGVLLIGAAASLLQALSVATTDLGEPGSGPLLALINALSALPILAFAHLARTIVRGSRDLGRPPRARAMAAASVLCSVIGWIVLLAVWATFWAMTTFQLDTEELLTRASIGLFAEPLAWVLLVVAFGLGLADTSGRIAE